jgi:hypothetical protein
VVLFIYMYFVQVSSLLILYSPTNFFVTAYIIVSYIYRCLCVLACTRACSRLQFRWRNCLLRVPVPTEVFFLSWFPLPYSVADPDPESGAFLTPGSGMGIKSGSGS